jgi:hypothetical protein
MKQLEMEFKYLELLSEEEKEYLHKEQTAITFIILLLLRDDNYLVNFI